MNSADTTTEEAPMTTTNCPDCELPLDDGEVRCYNRRRTWSLKVEGRGTYQVSAPTRGLAAERALELYGERLGLETVDPEELEQGRDPHEYVMPAVEEHDPADVAMRAQERAELDSPTVPGTTVSRREGGEEPRR